VRSAKFIPKKQWIVVGADDGCLHIYNYNTSEIVKEISAHGDYIRCVLVHSTLPYVLSCSDDLSIKLWDWENNWKEINTYDDHEHYIMDMSLNPKDTNTFASASLDKTIKIWHISTSKANSHYSLVGHQAGVNCLDYCHMADRPYIVSGGDDCTVKVWDY